MLDDVPQNPFSNFILAGAVALGVGVALIPRESIKLRQADRIRNGVPLREQVHFATYLAARSETPSLTFRDHLRNVGGAIEV